MVAPDVPSAVSNLLDATRRLEESLHRWGSLEITETEVSDVFVTVGNCYNEMLAAFSVYHIDMGDVSTFLNDLRTLLEECLSEDPTPQNLNYLMPQVRTIIANLLVGLRNKQAYYWRAVSAASGSGTRRSSGGSQTGSRSSSGSGYR
ncbi:uncharacterized protein FOMMEDRAFT_137706 [Fomitiporia mediterranea MF3/22]|uniref:uncharacterized protein n=1 Tax=Fomitiporia mediterranea (strain MF3/22) TaxID=694068 RepID=UPI0004409264|nr:uncharacterized protein FOMMEDRAFT_137706 [Fomitiporia mediterranea MF3/22]EJD07370.1 hypothetical protein FOMMEDRAFT_137706 [Fomitiporia mediterranea MF3/22]